MLTARQELNAILARHQDDILKRWQAWIYQYPEFKQVQKEESIKTTGRAFFLFQEFFVSEETTKLEQFVVDMARTRFPNNFPCGAGLHAFEGLRSVMTPLMLEEISPISINKSLSILGGGVELAKITFAEEYQRLAKEKIENSLQLLISKVSELEQESVRSQQAAIIKDHFLSNITHEFKTPLTIIQGFSSLLSSGSAPPEKVIDMGAKIYRSGVGLLRMVNEIILLSRIESGEDTGNMYPVSLRDLLHKSIQNAIKTDANAERQWLFDEAGINLLVEGDSEKLVVMFTHLLENAAKFSAVEGAVTIRVARENGLACIDIIDQGIGILESDRNMIFEKFRQKRGGSDREFEGTGLGLALSRMIARLHSGDVLVMGRPDDPGSLFRVVLPLSDIKT